MAGSITICEFHSSLHCTSFAQYSMELVSAHRRLLFIVIAFEFFTDCVGTLGFEHDDERENQI